MIVAPAPVQEQVIVKQQQQPIIYQQQQPIINH